MHPIAQMSMACKHAVFDIQSRHYFRVMSRTQQQLGRTVPERDDDRIEIGQWFERIVEQTRKAHVGYFDTASSR
jgi:hypothetical protein